MLSSILSRFAGKSGKSSFESRQTVDISRVIPGYVSPYSQEAGDPTAEAAEPAPANENAPADLDGAAFEEAAFEAGLTEQYPEAAAEMESTPLVLTTPLMDDDQPAAQPDRHRAWLKRDLDQLVSCWKDARHDFTQLKYVARAAGTLAAMGQTYKHAEIARIAASLDKLLAHETAYPDVSLINLHVDACRAAFAENAKGGNALIAQSVCAALEEQVQKNLANQIAV